jgi:hypothetical protein
MIEVLATTIAGSVLAAIFMLLVFAYFKGVFMVLCFLQKKGIIK